MKISAWFILTGLTFSPYLSAKEIKLIADIWCPYTCNPTLEKPGFMVEIAQTVFKEQGYSIKYVVKNWTRAIRETRTGQYDAIIGASKADAPDFVYPTIPAGHMENYYWTLVENKWNYSGVDSLKTVKLGFISDYNYGAEVDKLIANKHPTFVVITGIDALSRMIQMTEAKLLDGFIENPTVLKYHLVKMKKETSVFKAVSSNLANDPNLFIAFSPKNNSSINFAQILDEGIISLRKNGKLKSILQKYGLNDWAK